MTHSPMPTAHTWGFEDQTDKTVPHSPMPWTLRGNGEIVCHDRAIAKVYQSDDKESEDRANALLATCAPSMYRVCKLIWSAASIMNDGPDDSDRAQAGLYMDEALRLATQIVKVAENRVPR